MCYNQQYGMQLMVPYWQACDIFFSLSAMVQPETGWYGVDTVWYGAVPLYSNRFRLAHTELNLVTILIADQYSKVLQTLVVIW